MWPFTAPRHGISRICPDPDENYFVLFGGQDGWLGSANFADQIGLWRQGNYIRMPLREESIAAEFPLLMDLEPAP